jgi:hypothetical protein
VLLWLLVVGGLGEEAFLGLASKEACEVAFDSDGVFEVVDILVEGVVLVV